MKLKNKEPLCRIVEDRNEIFVYGERKHLALKEFQIVAYLKKINKTVTREDLIDEVWAGDDSVDIRTVDQHVCRIRRKVGFNIVESVPGVGYRIAAL